MTAPARPFSKERNDLDFASLEAGDIVLMSNPWDRWYMRYTIFWSHAGLVTGKGGQEAIIDVVREPYGDYDRVGQRPFYQVHYCTYEAYARNYDLIALRVRCPLEVRQAAVCYAEGRIGTPYSPNIKKIIFNRHDTDHYSCSVLIWQAYRSQGIDLSPAPFGLNVTVMPYTFAHSRHVRVVAVGTRYMPIPRNWRNLGLILRRWWYRNVLRAPIADWGTEDRD